MTDLHVAASEIRKIAKAFAGLAVLGDALDAAVSADATLTALKKQIDDARRAADAQTAAHAIKEREIAEHLAKIAANADAAEKAAVAEHAALKAKHADELKKAKDKLEDIKEATDTAVKTYESKHAAAEKKLVDAEAAIAVAEKKLADINAAIAAIAGR